MQVMNDTPFYNTRCLNTSRVFLRCPSTTFVKIRVADVTVSSLSAAV